MNQMNAMVYTKYGPPDVLQLIQVDKPQPKDNELLIKIKATAANTGDVRLRKADPWAVRLIFGLTKPRLKILGSVLSGEVEAVGKAVKRFKVGDKVFGATGMHFGAYAEYICLPENGVLTLKPDMLSHAEAAVIPFGATTALYFLKKAAIKPGQKLLIAGSSGAIGTAAVQLAKAYGAEVTAVCSTGNIELVKSLGADKVIDYTKEDFTNNGETYDVIYDSIRTISVSASLKSLNKKGIMILSAASMSEILQGKWISITGGKKVLTGVVRQTADDLNFLRELILAGKLKPVIDRTYPLEQMAEAHYYVEQGHKKGNVAITI